MKRKLCAILCATLLAGLLVPIASAATFTDTSGHWAAAYIKTCADLGIVDGVGNRKFEPENPVTNAEFVKMLCAAFYTPGSEAYQISNAAEVSAYYGGNVPWYGLKSYYFRECGLLNAVDYDILSPDSANRPMNRNNMAQAAANVLENQIISVSEAQQTTAQSAIPDYYSIPEINRSAVKVCYALGVIQGTDGGKFDGGSTMTRAQACTVITRLLDAVGKKTTPEIPAQPVTPEVPTEKDIAVTTRANAILTGVLGGPFHGTAYNIADSGNPTGYLANGKPINEANIAELLQKAKEIWPTGMAWSEATTNNNWYGNPGTVARGMMRPYFTSSYAGCGGFASLISDYLFGKESNPYHVVTNFSDIRPGDVIVQLNTNKSTKHVMIVTSVLQTGRFAGDVFVAEGNTSDMVSWPDETDEWYSCDNDTLACYGSYVVLSRWPD